MELYVFKDLSGQSGMASQTQPPWSSPGQPWLARRLAVMAVRVRAEQEPVRRPRRKRGGLLGLRGRGVASTHRRSQ
jgi:hypothetical protein